MLLVGQDQATVEADLGVFVPTGKQAWGGLLRCVPMRLAAAMQQSGEALLRMPGGQERRIRPAGKPRLDRQGRLVVAFIGEGTIPTE
ncbi:hypothetical protein OHB33_41310 (plasmid) [Streptomyces sp. NBC_01558]|uniref:hypothetical protein n=1 Tax=Streptomyces sp. NBC_01558 TaxID=2975878 RepID=UPI002DDA8C4E|nr:hypothetical protein [Streptomyces sp. NBC_01558]WSD82824.1 hypothetical protein OHB33_41310 [Streptomyces sp. NBC_01558]